jgi:hypothetical protein
MTLRLTVDGLVILFGMMCDVSSVVVGDDEKVEIV